MRRLRRLGLWACSLLGSGLAAPQAWAQRLPLDQRSQVDPAPSRRESLGGAYDRAMWELELVRRGKELEQVNVGGGGRRNATRREVQQAEGEAFRPRPLSGY